MTFLITNEEEAREVLQALQVFYREPVQRVSDYCAVFNEWADLVATSPRTTVRPDQVAAMRLAIRKSSYLDRRLYGGEKHRTRPCPVHLGVWSGLPSPGNECECDLTGWLPEEEKP